MSFYDFFVFCTNVAFKQAEDPSQNDKMQNFSY